MRRLPLLIAFFALGCTALEEYSPWREGFAHVGDRFGYVSIHAGIGGIPGQDDIRPGPSWTITAPPGGAFATALAVSAFAADIWVLAQAQGTTSGYAGIFTPLVAGEPINLDEWAPAASLQGEYRDVIGKRFVDAVALDLYLTGSCNRDLSFGGRINTVGVGLDLALLVGFHEAGRGRLMAGIEYRYINFKNRPNADNFGPMLGAGIEFPVGPDLTLSTQFRYVFTGGEMPQYDLWDFSMGVSRYW